MEFKVQDKQHVIPENARHETLEFLDIADVKDGDEISTVQFKCGGCRHCFDTIPIGSIRGMQIVEISQKRCSCGEYSGFDYRENKTDTPDKLRELCAVLTGGLKRTTEKQRWLIGELLKDRNLKL